MRSGTLVLFCLPFLAACAVAPPPAVQPRPQATALPESGRPRSTTVYQCGDERLVLAAWGPERLTLHGLDLVETLERVAPATEAHYRGPDTELWAKIDSAVLVHRGLTRSGCVRLPEEEPWEAARLASVSFRAAGYSPKEWSAENGYKEGLVLSFDGQTRQQPYRIPSEDSLTGTLSFGGGEEENIDIEAVPQPCRDTVTGQVYESTVSVDWGGLKLKGCGKTLR